MTGPHHNHMPRPMISHHTQETREAHLNHADQLVVNRHRLRMTGPHHNHMTRHDFTSHAEETREAHLDHAEQQEATSPSLSPYPKPPSRKRWPPVSASQIQRPWLPRGQLQLHFSAMTIDRTSRLVLSARLGQVCSQPLGSRSRRRGGPIKRGHGVAQSPPVWGCSMVKVQHQQIQGHNS